MRVAEDFSPFDVDVTTEEPSVDDLRQAGAGDERWGIRVVMGGNGAWMSGAPLDIDTMLRTADGRPRCAIVTTAHLSDEERQFVTTLVLSKLVTWMRRQSGTTDLRALLYMDEVAGYLPPTAMPPTKKPIMTQTTMGTVITRWVMISGVSVPISPSHWNSRNSGIR
jgi:hypothetical protein